MNREILSRLTKEFWAPAIVATAWTVYSIIQKDSGWTLTSVINIFGPSFFLVSPTSATRAKKASNLLILRSWGRKGRHYKVMLWLGHEGGIGGDLGG